MALARTEEDQLELAVRQHARLVYRIAYSVLRNHHDARTPSRKRSLLSCERGGNWLGWMIHSAGSHGLPGGCGGTETEMARDFVGRNRGEVRAATLGGNTRG
jgi:hypothetical protein